MNKETASPEPSSGQRVSLYAARKKIHPRAVTGTFASWRWRMVWFTQLFFYGACWLDWDGRQAVLFHLAERKFYIFGLTLWPQDAIYLAVLLVISACALFLVTAVGGRLFCGYACPQTVYTEIFLWIEEKVEGDRSARIKLDAQPMSWNKFRRRALKHALWFAVAFWSGFTFVGYFTPIRELAANISAFRLGGWEVFWFFFYSLFLYFMAGFMREQMCKYLCPYARFQGVMFDPDTLIITYDAERGEPRGPRRKRVAAAEETLGDCVDCSLCVQVCPTGIDIRNGLQIECIACAACIDVCDSVMDKIGLPRGLVRYSTENAMLRKYSSRQIIARLLRPRTLIYSLVLLLVVSGMLWSLFSRTPLRVDVLRDRAALYREAEDERIENVFTLRIMNVDDAPHHYTIGVSGIDGIRVEGAAMVEVPAAESKSVTVVASVEDGKGKSGPNPIVFDVSTKDDESIVVREKTTFFLP